ncbi:MAG: hypothetical protein AAGF23_04865 [Acidobacteriota bacterium]
MKYLSQSSPWIVSALLALFVSTTGLEAQLIVGGPSADGSLKVRQAFSIDSLFFEVDPSESEVSVGSFVTGNETDIDFGVADFNGNDWAVLVNGSSSLLQVGSPLSSDDGDLQLYNGGGALVFEVNGGNGGVTVGAAGEDGDLEILDTSGSRGFNVDGNSGTVTNALGGEGLIKAWCRVNSDGILLDGFRCSATTYEGGGQFYTADFTALATDISARGILLTVNEYGSDQSCTGEVLPTDLSTLRISCSNQVQFFVAIF